MKYLSSEDDFEEAVKYINSGKLVIFPTETVYGIGANTFDAKAVESIFKMKGRKQDNPLIVHISNLAMLDNLVEEVGKIEKRLIDKFWPGPLTIIFKKKKIIPDVVTCGLDTVGIRMPSFKVANRFIEECGTPIAAPSANLSGKPSGTILEDVMTDFLDEDIYFIDGGESEIGVESTVVKVVENTIVILRPGYITKEDLSQVAPTIVSENVFKKVDENTKVVESPGMKYRHYAPSCKCALVVGNTIDVIRKKTLDLIRENFEESTNAKVVVMYRFSEPDIKLDKVTYINMGNDELEVSRNIYHLLRKVDKLNPDIVYIEGVEKKGLGIAIMNRLIRACEYNII